MPEVCHFLLNRLLGLPAASLAGEGCNSLDISGLFIEHWLRNCNLYKTGLFYFLYEDTFAENLCVWIVKYKLTCCFPLYQVNIPCSLNCKTSFNSPSELSHKRTWLLFFTLPLSPFCLLCILSHVVFFPFER